MSNDHHDCCSPAEKLLRQNAAQGCPEARMLMSRRAVLGGITATLFSSAYMPRWANAAGGGDPRLLVVILRGGMDGVNVCVPFGDKGYVKMRGDIAIPASSTIKLDGFFGLHPALKHFGDMYKAKESAIVHACCVPLRNRSHFDCQDNLENGMPDNSMANATGWINRLLTYLKPSNNSVYQHGAIQISEAPLIMRGPERVLGWSSTWFEKVQNPTLKLVRGLYSRVDAEMSNTLERGLTADRIATKAGAGGGDVSGLRQAFRGAAALVAADNGPRIAVLSVDGWDTHADQGGANGYMSDVLTELDLSINDFKATAGAAWKNTVVVCATEFGRTVHVNGDKGTDHGVGTTVLLAGGSVNGGHVFMKGNNWPGISQNQLYEDSDLEPTTDLRSVFKGILRDHLGVIDSGNAVFPGSGTLAPPMKSLVKTGSADVQAVSSGAKVAARAEPAIARFRRGEKTVQAHS